MCGIVAFLSNEGGVLAETLERATRTLEHRGPDAHRQWISRDGKVGLGHQRLRIIDLTTGDQPIASPDEKVRIVVNGEFYSFEAIRSWLEKKGHVFRTRSDSEILIPLYAEYGVHALKHLRGEFALVLWDERKKQLFAARDRFGIKPLFYAHHQGTLFLASEVKALFAAGVPAEWDWETMYQLNAARANAPDRTLFKNIFQIPPGHFILASEWQFRILPYWDLDYPKIVEEAEAKIDEKMYIERVSEKLHEAVRLRLRADVPVGCYLSGGLDSCSALGIASLYAKEPVHAFTLTFQDSAYDEGKIAEEMARHAGAKFDPIPVRDADVVENFAKAVWSGEGLIHNAHVVSKFILSRHVRDAGYKVVLTGEGADEIFAGYPHFRKDMLNYLYGNDPALLKQHVDELFEANPVSRGLLIGSSAGPRLDPFRKILGFVPSYYEVTPWSADDGAGILSREFYERFRERDPYSSFLDSLDVPGRLTGRHPVNQAMYLWSKTMLPTYLLTQLGDRMEMAHSIEGRLPFLDHELAELVAGLPVSLKIKGVTEKYVLREAAKPVLTDTVYRRQKHPFIAPPAALPPDGPLYQLVQETLRGGMLRSVPFYDQKKVVRLLDALPKIDEKARHLVDSALMTMASVAYLQRIFSL
jgi:asparagine synthase (glutamine-hydrolysing)